MTEIYKQIIMYQLEDGSTSVEVHIEHDTLWLSQAQIADLFGTKRPAITKHLGNIFKTDELDQKSVCSILEHTAADGKKYKTKFYNLDAIISVGYRVNSRNATRFRIWANEILKEYLIKGYALNEQFLRNKNLQIQELKKTLDLFEGTLKNDLDLPEAQGLLRVITDYTHSFILLNRYDSDKLSIENLNQDISYVIEYGEAVAAINDLRHRLNKHNEASDLFGNQKDKSFQGILISIVQTFDNQYLYPSIEEQAAHLLYFVIKNHPFSDGNKRIGAFLFVWFLERNKHHLKKSGEIKINDNALVAIALMVAQSNPSDKETLIRLIINLIRDKEIYY